MQQENQPTTLRTFLIIWCGQFASVLGSEMTNFAITIWAWNLAGQATPLSLIFFFTYTPRVVAASFAGLFVDRWNRKYLMILGDAAAGLSTITILLLFLTDHLEIWHLYITGAINGLFGYFQALAYSASMSMIVPKQHYTRAGAMSYYITYFGSEILAPTIAGALYTVIGLVGIMTLDLMTFILAVSTVSMVKIPQPHPSQAAGIDQHTLWQELTFGFRYIFQRSSLVAVLIFLLSSNFVFSVCLAIHAPMILARSGDDAAALAIVQSAMGMGGVCGAILISIWGGPKRRIHGLLFSAILTGFGGVLMGLGRGLLIWPATGFFAAFFAPLRGTSNQAIWLSKVEPDVQGRVFASRYLIAQIASPLGLAIAGPLADSVFSPAMMPGGSLAGLLGGVFGTEPGAGLALEYTLFSLGGVLIGVWGYAFRQLREVETLVPDHGSADPKLLNI